MIIAPRKPAFYVNGVGTMIFLIHNEIKESWPTTLDTDVSCLHCGKLLSRNSPPNTIPLNYDSTTGIYTTFGFVCSTEGGFSCAKGYLLEHPNYCSEFASALVGQLEYDMFQTTIPLKPAPPRILHKIFRISDILANGASPSIDIDTNQETRCEPYMINFLRKRKKI